MLIKIVYNIPIRSFFFVVLQPILEPWLPSTFGSNYFSPVTVSSSFTHNSFSWSTSQFSDWRPYVNFILKCLLGILPVASDVFIVILSAKLVVQQSFHVVIRFGFVYLSREVLEIFSVGFSFEKASAFLFLSKLRSTLRCHNIVWVWSSFCILAVSFSCVCILALEWGVHSRLIVSILLAAFNSLLLNMWNCQQTLYSNILSRWRPFNNNNKCFSPGENSKWKYRSGSPELNFNLSAHSLNFGHFVPEQHKHTKPLNAGATFPPLKNSPQRYESW